MSRFAINDQIYFEMAIQDAWRGDEPLPNKRRKGVRNMGKCGSKKGCGSKGCGGKKGK